MSVQFAGRLSHDHAAFPAEPSHRLTVVATNEPGALSRVLEPLAKRGITASRVLAECIGEDLRVLVDLTEVDGDSVERIARETSGSWLVRHVSVERVASRVRVVGASTAEPCPWCGF